MTEKIVFLKYKGSNTDEEFMSIESCAACRNKTFVIIYDGEDYPLMKCSVCGSHIGRIGYVDPEIKDDN